MSLVDGSADLSGLARNEDDVQPPRRSWLRIAVPLVILGAFAFVLRDTLVDLVVARPEVTLVRPVRLEGAAPLASLSSGEADSTHVQPSHLPKELVVQAAGWVEPDPFPALAPALSGGVVEEMLVQEADPVTEGQVIARLVEDDALLAHREALALVETRRSAVALSKVKSAIAAERFDAALEVTEAATSAAARLKAREADARLGEAALVEGRARVDLAKSEVIVQEELDAAGASGARQVEIAAAELQVAEARLATLEANLAHARAAEVEARAQDERARADLRLRFVDRLARDESAAAEKHAEAQLMEAESKLASAALVLERTEVRSPTDGVILERLAVAGETLQPGHAVASLYSPTELRVRVDVPQGDIERVSVGQPAEVLADARPGRPYRGTVVRIVSQADIQKVTVEAQVRVLDADGLLRPDMLTQVRFYSGAAGLPDGLAASPGAEPQADQGGTASTIRLRLGIPARVVRGGALWVLDPVAGTAVRREVELGESIRLEGQTEGQTEGLVEVLGGLNLTDKVVDRGVDVLQARFQGGEATVAVDVAEAVEASGEQGASGAKS